MPVLSQTLWAQEKPSKEEIAKKQAEIDAAAAAVVKKMIAESAAKDERKKNPPPSTELLQTPSDAAKDATLKANKEGRIISYTEMKQAYDKALAAEIKAYKEGQLERIKPSELSAVYSAIQQATEAAKKSKCDGPIGIGSSESQVYYCMGTPLHTNSSLQGGDQLVYSGGTYVYIDAQTRLVVDIQHNE